ncbi:hypothetical protein [Streptomyces sp. NPDC048845]|uniref:hypothetical protein n=1 Tax=Streptomyces sp. NPDC048845 TaxID=3155390 RepID=UPI003419FEE3
MENIFSSERSFKTWQYSVSHRRLLIRSVREAHAEHGTRIDILFSGVTHLCVKPVYEGLVIRKGNQEEVVRLSEFLDIQVDQRELYLLGHGLSSFVISGAPPQWREDERYSDEPSRLGFLPGTP